MKNRGQRSRQELSPLRARTSLVKQCSPASEPEILKRVSPEPRDVFGRITALQAFERVCINQQARITINFPVGRKQAVQRHCNLETGEHGSKLSPIGDDEVYSSALFILKDRRPGAKANRNEAHAGDYSRI